NLSDISLFINTSGYNYSIDLSGYVSDASSYQLKADIWDATNYSEIYASVGFDNENFSTRLNTFMDDFFDNGNWSVLYLAESGTRWSITNYSAEYSSTGFKIANGTALSMGGGGGDIGGTVDNPTIDSNAVGTDELDEANINVGIFPNNVKYVSNNTNVNFDNLTINNASIGGHALTVTGDCINWTIGTTYWAVGSSC
ncbi:hypothetical protein LCGC14_1552770, partial [marine sediment metagenome]